jgi:hypothetical protein
MIGFGLPTTSIAGSGARLGDGGVWLIRRVPQGSGPDVCLLAPAWYAAAYPDWSTEKVQKSARKALKKARRP